MGQVRYWNWIQFELDVIETGEENLPQLSWMFQCSQLSVRLVGDSARHEIGRKRMHLQQIKAMQVDFSNSRTIIVDLFSFYFFRHLKWKYTNHCNDKHFESSFKLSNIFTTENENLSYALHSSHSIQFYTENETVSAISFRSIAEPSIHCENVVCVCDSAAKILYFVCALPNSIVFFTHHFM